ncbi:MAG: hypothetical protein B7Y45_07815 [Sphingomonas sp. 28-66-16]|nr:MAG: hypothetical protein B7Y45_07815 [Sphingomonas sp. 28-66-16]
MSAAIEAHARAIAARAETAATTRAAARLAAALPDLSVSAVPGAITIEGKRLVGRRSSDPRLRWIAGLLR